jgi:hypothetical protein
VVAAAVAVVVAEAASSAAAAKGQPQRYSGAGRGSGTWKPLLALFVAPAKDRGIPHQSPDKFAGR